jgi:hypothetical protein
LVVRPLTAFVRDLPFTGRHNGLQEIGNDPTNSAWSPAHHARRCAPRNLLPLVVGVLQDAFAPVRCGLSRQTTQLAAWRRDYQTMRGEMFFGDVPTFDEILRVVGEFEWQFNDSASASN